MPARTPAPAPRAHLCARATAGLWRNPLILVSLALLAAAWIVPAARSEQADLTLMSISGTAPGLLVAAVVFAVGAMTATRARRSGVEEVEGALPAPDAARGLAALCAVGSVALAVAGLDALRLLLHRSPSAVGTILWWEVAACGLIVAAAGALGHMLAGLTRSLPVALVVLFALVVLGFLGYVVLPGLGPWIAGSGYRALSAPPLPAQALGRPLAGRAAWLACVCLACTWLILLRPPRLPRTGALPTACAVALTLAVGAGALTADLTRAVPAQVATRERIQDSPGSYHECAEVAGTRYCTLPGYSARVGTWSRIVDGVVSRTPEASRTALAIEQRLHAPAQETGGSPGSPSDSGGDAAQSILTGPDARPQDGSGPVVVPVSTRWAAPGDSGSINQAEVALLALRVASTQVTGSPAAQGPAGSPGRMGPLSGLCGARGALALYLAQSASPASEAAFAALAAHSTGADTVMVRDPDTGSGLVIGPEESALAASMRERREQTGSTHDMDAALAAHWQTLTDPATTTAQAAGILGLPVPGASTATGLCPSGGS